jgi:hypothetical protein
MATFEELTKPTLNGITSRLIILSDYPDDFHLAWMDGFYQEHKHILNSKNYGGEKEKESWTTPYLQQTKG